MNQQTNHADRHCNCSQDDRGSIKNFTEFTVTFREFLPTTSGQVSRNTRITSRRFTKSNRTLTSDIHSSNFAGMNFSSVVSTRSWSGPSVNNLSSSLNTHGVPSFDGADIAPTDVVTPEWINNFDSIIRNLQERAMQDQIEAERHQASKSNGQEGLANLAGKDSLKNHDGNNAVCNCRSNSTGFTSKDFGVGHDSILAQGAVNV